MCCMAVAAKSATTQVEGDSTTTTQARRAKATSTTSTTTPAADRPTRSSVTKPAAASAAVSATHGATKRTTHKVRVRACTQSLLALRFCTIFSSNYAHCPHTMSVYLSGVCSPVSPSVRLYVPAWAHSSKPAAAGLLLWARPAGDNDQLLHGTQQRRVRWANAGATLSAYVGSWTQTCYTNFMLGLGLEVLIS